MSEPIVEKQKLKASEVVAELVARHKVLGENLEQESRARSLGQSAVNDEVDKLKARVGQLETSLFILFSCYLDLINPAQNSEDPEVVDDAKYHANLSLLQQSLIAPDLYERSYGYDAQTGELLPGRSPGVPINEAGQTPTA